MTVDQLWDVHFVLLGAAGGVGMVAHWAKRWLKDKTKTPLFDYLFREHARYTAYSFICFHGALVALLAAVPLDPHSVQSLATVFLLGYTIDSIVNKDFTDAPPDPRG